MLHLCRFMKTLILSILVVGHLVLAANRLFDLYTRSKRSNKTHWMLLIVLVPVVGVMRYNATMQRRRYLR
jgi:uncharacterized membrane protein YhaH (DUF805 family)